MPRDYRVYLEDMLVAAQKVEKYTAGLSLEILSGDEKTVDAVVRNLEIIGEAAKQVPGDIRTANPEVDWARICGLRDVLIHQYFGIDIVIVWDIVQNKIPVLLKQVRDILSA
jgi:uncharacterized protein with HEPN domain